MTQDTALIVLPSVAFFCSLAAHAGAQKLFPQWGLLDFPERYGLTRSRLPYPTGIVAAGLFTVFFATIQPLLPDPWSLQNVGLIAGILLLTIAAFSDDRRPRTPWMRIGIQSACALLIFATGTRIYSLTNPLDFLTGIDQFQLDTLVLRWPLLSDPSLVGAVFTVVWLGLTINALNWFDGIPGQVSALSIIGFLTIGFLSLSTRVDQPHLALLSFLLAAIALGSLLFDIPPPRVLMGDTGAMFYGLMLGVLTIYAGGKVATAFLVLGVPLIDFGIVLLRRAAKGQPLLRSNTTDEHLHHRLLSRGWSPRAVIALTAALGSLFGITALFLTTAQKFIAALLLLFIMIALSLYSRPRRD